MCINFILIVIDPAYIHCGNSKTESLYISCKMRIQDFKRVNRSRNNIFFALHAHTRSDCTGFILRMRSESAPPKQGAVSCFTFLLVPDADRSIFWQKSENSALSSHMNSLHKRSFQQKMPEIISGF